MSQKFIDKIAIIISWPREIDLYSNFLNADNNNQIFDIIVNDIPSIERGRNKSNKLIQSLLENKETKFKLAITTGSNFDAANAGNLGAYIEHHNQSFGIKHEKSHTYIYLSRVDCMYFYLCSKLLCNK